MPRGWGLAATKERRWDGNERYSEWGFMIYNLFKPQLAFVAA